MKYIISVFTIITLLLSLISCADHIGSTDTELSTGYLLTPEDINQIKDSFEGEEATITVDADTVFYWTDSGTKFHIFKDCQALSRTAPENISEGKISKMQASGKRSFCSFCSKRADVKEEDIFGNIE